MICLRLLSLVGEYRLQETGCCFQPTHTGAATTQYGHMTNKKMT